MDFGATASAVCRCKPATLELGRLYESYFHDGADEMTVVCYPQPGKGRSLEILRRFAAGCGGRVASTPAAKLEPGPAAFFGVVGIEHLLNEARDTGRDWWYLDNSFFDCTRKSMIRVGHNALQDDGTGKPDWDRFRALGIKVEPWKPNGWHIVVCVQSDHFMREVCREEGGDAGWLLRTTDELMRHTDRQIIVRAWSNDKEGLSRTLPDDLRNAWALVTHTSAAAIGAILSGVPAFLTGPCAALTMGSGDISEIENPRRPADRERWAAALARMQFSLDELRNGTAWRTLCDTAG